MPFAKGSSGNPAGRPNRDRQETKRSKVKSTKREMRAYLQKKFGESGKQIVDAMAEIAFHPNAGVRERLAALQELANRGWGRPTALSTETVEAGPLFTLDKEPSMDPEPVS